MTKAYVSPAGIYLMSFDGEVPPPTEDAVEVATAPYDARQVWDFVAEEWGPVPAPEPAEPYLNNGGLIRFSGNPVIVAENIRFAGASRLVRGRFRAAHLTPYPSDQYSAVCSVKDPNRCTIQVTARTAAYIEVRVWDAAGALYDPQEITITTERVINP